MKFFLEYLLLLIFASNYMCYGQIIDFEDEKWHIDTNHIIENFKGHKSLYLQKGNAYLMNANFEKGIIEYDVYLTERVSFSGLLWHVQDKNNYEEFYVRTHHSGHPDAYQYTPVFNGNPAWQLYHDPYSANNNGLIGFKPLSEGNGYNGILELPMDQWVHFKYVISGNQAEVYINNEETPSVFIKEMIFPEKSGGIGIRSSAGPTHFANLSYQKIPNLNIVNKGKPKYKIEAGTIINWNISSGFNKNKLLNVINLRKNIVENLKWSKLKIDKPGFLNISRVIQKSKDINTALVSFEIDSDKSQIKKIEFGYSDEVKVYLNNIVLYEGSNKFRSRDYRYLGTIGYFDALYLDLKKGKNTIIFAVSENFGGWGVQARFVDIQGVKIHH